MVVHRARSGQSRQAAPKMALRVGVIGRVTPFGQVTVPGWSAVGSTTVNSSRVNPPSTAGRSGHGLMIGMCPASRSAARASPVP